MSEDLPLYPDPLVGFKVMRLSWPTSPMVLRSPTFMEEWWREGGEPPQWKRARCSRIGEEVLEGGLTLEHPLRAKVPWKTCKCGFWAYFDYEQARRESQAIFHRASIHKAVNIVTLVIGDGDWLRNEISWRSEMMRIVAVCGEHWHKGDEIFRAAEGLEVPALTVKEIKEFASSAGMGPYPT